MRSLLPSGCCDVGAMIQAKAVNRKFVTTIRNGDPAQIITVKDLHFDDQDPIAYHHDARLSADNLMERRHAFQTSFRAWCTKSHSEARGLTTSLFSF